MLKITIGNSMSSVTGFDTKTFAALRKALSYTPVANTSYFAGKAYNQRRYLIDKKGGFPSGLLYLVRQTLTALKQPFQEQDTRIAPKRPAKPLFILRLK